jgi:hypothetical protein
MTGPLKNARHERFAQELAKSSTLGVAYVAAGYARNDKNAARLRKNEGVAARVAELMAGAAEKAKIDAAWVLEQAVDLHEKAKAAGAFSPAARALELVGKHIEVQAFREQMQHSGSIEYRNLSDEEIAARIAAHEATRASHPTTH